MSWIKLGTRYGSIFQKSKKIKAWSEGLKSELGFGFTQFIVTKDGAQFVLSGDGEEIKKIIKQRNFNLKYLDKTKEANREIEKELKEENPDYKKLLDLSLKQLAYFYIANESADLIYENLNDSDKKRVEQWRNNPDLFIGDDQTSVKLASKLSITQDSLEVLTVDEVEKALEGQMPNVVDIKNRLDNDWSLVLKDGRIKFFLEDLSPVKTSDGNTRLIKGRVAFKVEKKIIGVVGQDILVAWMTRPDMVQLMRKMKAVITDEGGVLCHAAITAREFKIPTIIGTKIATKVLKDGDKVEINIPNGTVRILN